MKKFDCYIGIDVSKLTLDVSVLREEGDIAKTEYYKIENSEKSISQFVKKQLGHYVLEQMLFCFEDTGIYSIPLVYYLNDNKLAYWQVPSLEIKRSRGITRGKSDKIDAKDIAFYAYTQKHKFKPSRISTKPVQQLRLLFSEREKVLKSLASFGRTSENKDFISKDVFKVVASINRTVVKQLTASLKSIEKKMMSIITSETKLNQQYELITSIPGVGKQTAIYIIIATKGFDVFEHWRQLACYAGIAPFPYQSGTSIRGRNKVHPLADRKMKSLLNMCALVSIRHDKSIKAYYERKVKEGKPKMLVVNNIRCKLLARVFAVINRGTPFVNICKFAA